MQLHISCQLCLFWTLRMQLRAIPSNRMDIKLVAIDSLKNSAFFGAFEVHFSLFRHNIFATFYFEISGKWSKSQMFE